MSSSLKPHRCCSPRLFVAAVRRRRRRVSPGYYGYGTPATPAQIAGWDIDVRVPMAQACRPAAARSTRAPTSMPTNARPATAPSAKARARYPKLAGGEGTLTERAAGADASAATGPSPPTLCDYINRAMPFPAPHTLSADDVYAITAYVLNINNIVANNFVADRDSLPKVKMPNHDHFIWTGSAARYVGEGMHEGLRRPENDQDRIDGGRKGPDAADHRAARRRCNRNRAGDNGLDTRGGQQMELRQPQFVLARDCRRRSCSARALPRRAAASDGQKLAFDRSKGNCLTCHEIKGGDAPGNVGPPLDGHEDALSRSQGTCRDHFRRDQAQSADGDAAVQAQPAF